MEHELRRWIKVFRKENIDIIVELFDKAIDSNSRVVVGEGKSGRGKIHGGRWGRLSQM